MDCFGDHIVTGKIGTDIEDNKCTWLINVALSIANSDQKTILEDNYGINNPENVLKVKEIYSELKIEQLYKDYEISSFDKIQTLINGLEQTILPNELFVTFINRIYKRTK